MDPWQADDLVNVLGERPDGKWAATEVGLIVPRQNGKGSVLEARVLAGLFLFEERTILWSAHEFKTSQEAYRRLLEHIETTPHLDALVKRKLNNTTETSIELVTGQRVRFVARSKGSGRGFTGDVVILDEAYKLPAEMMEALVPTMAARPNRQLWFTSSAPLPGPESDSLRRLCLRGRSGEGGRLAFSEYCVPSISHDGVDLDDRDLWYQANPGMVCGRLSEEAVETERLTLTDEGFARERLGIHDPSPDAGGLIPMAAWLRCEDQRSGPVGDVGFALDVSPQRDRASIGVAGASGTGGTHLEVVEAADGTDWVVERCGELEQKWGCPLAVAKGSPAAALVPALEAAGVRVVEVSTENHAKACGALFDSIMQAKVKHLGQPVLNVAVGGADRKFYGDAWMWARRTSSADITPLVAVGLAKWAHENARKPALSVW